MLVNISIDVEVLVVAVIIDMKIVMSDPIFVIFYQASSRLSMNRCFRTPAQ